MRNSINSSNQINMRHNFFTIGLLIILTGCANNNRWVKNGAGTNELKADEYSCMQYSQQHQGTVTVNQYGGKAESGQATNLNLFNSCMESKGWSLQNKDASQAAPVQKKADLKQQKTEVKVAMNKFTEKINAVCTKSEFAPIFLKTSCLDGDITAKQIADNSNITAEQKPIFLKYHTEIDLINNESSKYLHSLNLGSDVSQITDFIDLVRLDIEKLNLNLYKEKITWGEYNQQRKDFSAKIQAEIRRLSQSK